jgi:hypothetical protein
MLDEKDSFNGGRLMQAWREKSDKTASDQIEEEGKKGKERKKTKRREG